jgi:hypothetical protein
MTYKYRINFVSKEIHTFRYPEMTVYTVDQYTTECAIDCLLLQSDVTPLARMQMVMR